MVRRVDEQRRRDEEQRKQDDDEPQRDQESLPLTRIGQHLRDDVERSLDTRGLLDVDLPDGVDVRTRRDDGVDVLVLRTVSNEDDAVGLDLVEDLLQLGHECQVGAVPDLLVPADEGDVGLMAVLLYLEAHANRREEGVEVGILWVRYAEGCGRVQTVLDTDDGRVDLALDTEVIVSVDDQDQSLLHMSSKV